MSVDFMTAKAILQSICCEINPSDEWPLALEPILDRLGIVYRHVAAGEKRGVAYLQLGTPRQLPWSDRVLTDLEKRR